MRLRISETLVANWDPSECVILEDGSRETVRLYPDEFRKLAALLIQLADENDEPQLEEAFGLDRAGKA